MRECIVIYCNVKSNWEWYRKFPEVLELSWNPCFSLVGCFCLFILYIFSVSLVSAYSWFPLSYNFSSDWHIMTIYWYQKNSFYFFRDVSRGLKIACVLRLAFFHCSWNVLPTCESPWVTLLERHMEDNLGTFADGRPNSSPVSEAIQYHPAQLSPQLTSGVQVNQSRTSWKTTQLSLA